MKQKQIFPQLKADFIKIFVFPFLIPFYLYHRKGKRFVTLCLLDESKTKLLERSFRMVMNHEDALRLRFQSIYCSMGPSLYFAFHSMKIVIPIFLRFCIHSWLVIAY